MTWPNAFDSSTLLDIYVAANTPAHLLRRLRSELTTSLLAQTYNVDELVEFLTTGLAADERTSEEVARLYGILAAITLLPYSSWADLHDRSDLSKLDWGRRMLELAAAAATPTTSAVVRAITPRSQPRVNISSADGGILRLDEKPQTTSSDASPIRITLTDL